MKYILIAVSFLLTITYSFQGDVQSTTQITDVTAKQISTQNSTKPEHTEPTPTAKPIATNTTQINSTVHDVTQSANQTSGKNDTNQNGTKTVKEIQTEAPVIINDSTYPIPGTEVIGNDSTTIKPTTQPSPTHPVSTTKATPVTTLAPTNHSTTVSTVKPEPTAEPITPSPSQHRGFDGPSFVGGIVLALGLVAIGFVAFKFYKARTELNYHTL